uniref:Serpin domain-containing protein n=1 Tax=Timema douglasi TaxID=61478 RepID=A0A7R8VVX1_TIMDO|nr:unnamed protein product [Timema douglasi]
MSLTAGRFVVITRTPVSTDLRQQTAANRSMGVSELFSNGDLSGISGKNITVDEFWQHSGIQISEGSTEAISANALSYHAGFGYSHAKPEAVVEFRADHPFIFIIRENLGPVLFIGRYIGPNDDSPSSSESVEHEKVNKKESMTLAVELNTTSKLANYGTEAVATQTVSIDTTDDTTSKTSFAVDLYQVLKHQEKGSFAVSPVSIRASATILTVGTEGRAVDDIRHVLHIPANTLRVKMKTLYFLDKQKVTNVTTVKIGTALFPSEGLHINKQFQDDAEQYFKTEIIKLDYENKTDDAISMINGWIGRGVELYKRDSLPPSTMLVLVNTVTFKGSFLKGHQDSNLELPFIAGPGDVTQVPAIKMNVRARYRLLNKIDARAISLFYKGKDYSLVIILPNKVGGLFDLEDQMKGKDFSKLSIKKVVNATVILPKFKIGTIMDLRTILQKLGANGMFEHPVLTGLVENAQFRSVMLNAFAQVASIEVDEKEEPKYKGVLFPWGQPVESVEFKADHPFLFFIREKKTGLVLLMGRYNGP